MIKVDIEHDELIVSSPDHLLLARKAHGGGAEGRYNEKRDAWVFPKKNAKKVIKLYAELFPESFNDIKEAVTSSLSGSKYQEIEAFKEKYKTLAPGSVVQLPEGVTVADLDGWTPGRETDTEKQDGLDREVQKLIARFKQEIKFSKDRIAVMEMDAIDSLFPPVKTWWGVFKPLAQFMTFAFEHGLVGKYIPEERKVILKKYRWDQANGTVH